MSKLVYEEEMGEDKIVIGSFEDKDAEGLARLFNESDESWPGGFTHGVPYTAERVSEDVKREKALAYLLLTFNEQIIGVCTVHRSISTSCSDTASQYEKPRHTGKQAQ